MFTAIHPTFEAAPSLAAAAARLPLAAAADSPAPCDRVGGGESAAKPLALVVDDAPDVTEMLIGGQLFSDAMGAEGTPEGTYVGMVRYNTDTIVGALTQSAATPAA